MSARTEQLSCRRQELLARSGNERRQFARAADDLDQELRSIDYTITRVRELAKPAALVAGIASLLYFGRGKTFKLLTRGFFVYSALRRLLSNRRHPGAGRDPK